jgi:hypothetical protein
VVSGTGLGHLGEEWGLTTAWSLNASYEHYWTPSVHESLYGAYVAVNHDSQANAILCTAEGGGNGAAVLGGPFTAAAGCNYNWSEWGLGTRLQWDVTKSFYLGVLRVSTPTSTAPALSAM